MRKKIVKKNLDFDNVFMYIYKIVVGMQRDGSKKNTLNCTGFFE